MIENRKIASLTPGLSPGLSSHPPRMGNQNVGETGWSHKVRKIKRRHCHVVKTVCAFLAPPLEKSRAQQPR
jgi:hypothetical protein